MNRATVAPCASQSTRVFRCWVTPAAGSERALRGATSFPLAPKFRQPRPTWAGLFCLSNLSQSSVTSRCGRALEERSPRLAIKARQAPEQHLTQPRCVEAPRPVIGEHPSQGEKLYVH